MEKIVGALARPIETFAQRNAHPVVLASAQIRPHFRKMVERFLPNLAVLSYDEVVHCPRIQTLGTVELAHAN
jgi:flagellar biosynthesis protein FlhA